MINIKFQYLTDCSLWMIVCLAGENRIVTSRELEEKISFPQQSIFSAGRKLKKHGFINTVNGPYGGYILAKSPEDITIQEILSAYNDTFDVKEEPLDKKISTAALQNYTDKLKNVKDEMNQNLSFTLADLLRE